MLGLKLNQISKGGQWYAFSSRVSGWVELQMGQHIIFLRVKCIVCEILRQLSCVNGQNINALLQRMCVIATVFVFFVQPCVHIWYKHEHFLYSFIYAHHLQTEIILMKPHDQWLPGMKTNPPVAPVHKSPNPIRCSQMGSVAPLTRISMHLANDFWYNYLLYNPISCASFQIPNIAGCA